MPIMSKATTRIYLVRHGSTAWNEIIRFRGSTDIPLSENGRNQALALGRWFADSPLSAIFSSPLIRAQETARAISEPHHLPVLLRDGLRSVNYGSWEGQSETEVAKQDPEAFRLYLEGIDRFRFPRGETLDDLRQRAIVVLEEGIRTYPGQYIVLVTHQVVTRVLLCAVLGVDNSLYWRLGQDPGCINLAEWEGGTYRLQGMNWVPQESL